MILNSPYITGSLTTTGNVGIGTASPSYSLDVTGTGRFTSDLIGQASFKSVGRIFSTSDANYGDLVSTTGALVLSFDATGQQGYLTSRNYATATDKPLNYNGSSHIFNGGKVSISALDGESLKLQLATSTGNNYLRFYSSAGTALGYVGSFDSSGTQLMLVDGSGTDLSLNGNANLLLRTGGTERMRIVSAGNVCIGMTSSPYGLLAIKSNGTTPYYGLNVYANGNGNFTYANHDNNVGIIGTEFGVSGTGHTPLTFQVGGLERLRIGTWGDIGAMTAVTGQGSSQGNYRNFYWGSAVIMSRDAYDSYLCGNIYYDGSWKLKYASAYGNVVNQYSGEYSFLKSTTNGAANSVVSLQSNAYLDASGNLTIRGSLTQNGSPSDINLKENLVKITSPLEKISQINGYHFDWKEGTHANGLTIPVAEGMESPETTLTIAHDAGLIAQEVELIMPELVRDNGHKSLNYNGIIALLVESVKELKSQINNLQSQINELKA